MPRLWCRQTKWRKMNTDLKDYKFYSSLNCRRRYILCIIKLEFCKYYGSMLISIFIFLIYFTAPSVKGINCDCLVACKFASKIRPLRLIRNLQTSDLTTPLYWWPVVISQLTASTNTTNSKQKCLVKDCILIKTQLIFMSPKRYCLVFIIINRQKRNLIKRNNRLIQENSAVAGNRAMLL